jgi:lipopolysaccharide export system protein LptA
VLTLYLAAALAGWLPARAWAGSAAQLQLASAAPAATAAAPSAPETEPPTPLILSPAATPTPTISGLSSTPPAAPAGPPLQTAPPPIAPAAPPAAPATSAGTPAPGTPPATTPATPPTGGLLPAFPGPPAENHVVISALQVYLDDQGVMHATGKVLIKSVDYTLEADAASLDQDHIWAELSGNVSMQGKNLESVAGSIRVNLKTGEWHLTRGQATIEPGFFPGGSVTDKLYLQATSASSAETNGPIIIQGARLTSCDQASPHYYFSCREVEVRPGDRVIADHPVLYMWGVRVFELPFKLVLFLDQKHNQYLPEVGHDDVEGYYAKFAYAYLLSGLGSGLARLNLTTERGVGFGFDQRMDVGREQGLFSILYEPQEDAITSRLTNHYALGQSWVSDVDASYETNSGYFGNVATWAGNMLLSRHTSDGDLQVGYQDSLNDGGVGATSEQSTTTFTDHQRYGANSNMTLTGTWQDFNYGGAEPAQQSVNTNFEFDHTAGPLDMTLVASKLFQPPVASGQTGAYALDRLPELTVRTDSTRLHDYQLWGKIPFQTSLVLGDYNQDPQDLDVARAALDTTFGGNVEQWDKRTQATATGRFMQAFFSDSSAEYIIGGDLQIQRDLGNDWQSRLHFTHGETHGYEPISLDVGSREDTLTWETVQARTDRSRLDVATGYDFVGGFWQNATLSDDYMPDAHDKFSLQTGYDVENHQVLPLGLIWTRAELPHYYLTLAAEYDPGSIGLTQVSDELDWQVNSLWQVSMTSSYSGYTKTLETLDLQIQRDLHCMTATASYNMEQKLFSVGLGIKAFPNPEQALNVSNTGQQFQALPGQYF